MKYGSGPARFPLPDMLQYVLEFIATKSAVPVSPECVSSAQDSETTVLQSQAGSCILDMLSQPNRLVDRKTFLGEHITFQLNATGFHSESELCMWALASMMACTSASSQWLLYS